ncbi:MAG: hypothetical protein RLZZ293_944 [Pseudomonadota bacterium]|jgi:peptidyl-prolyl cis-trans isomerase SurA
MLKRIFLIIITTLTVRSFAQGLESANLIRQESSPTIGESSILAKPIVVNKIIAYVNKRIITANELAVQMQQARINLAQKGIPIGNESDFRNQVLDQMVMQQIQLDFANKSGIKTSDSEISDAISANEQAQHITDAQMQEKLAQNGISYQQFRQQIGDQITIEKFKQREVDGRIVINDDEINRILNSETYKNKIDYHLSDIMLAFPEQATQDLINQKQQLADQVYTLLKQGKPFEQLSIKYSSAPNALNGGDLGWKSNTTLPPLILAQISKLKTGEVSPVIKLPMGFFIFKLNGIKQHGSPQIVTQYHVRHILIKVNELTGDDEAQHKIIELRNKIIQYANNPQQESAEFVNLAKQYSEDASSIKGGDIGWVSKGDTVPKFEQTVFTTPIGQISQPIRTPFGWHILEVLETKETNLANAKEKAEIRQGLRDSKAQMLYVEWIRNLRELAYVKINNQ